MYRAPLHIVGWTRSELGGSFRKRFSRRLVVASLPRHACFTGELVPRLAPLIQLDIEFRQCLFRDAESDLDKDGRCRSRLRFVARIVEAGVEVDASRGRNRKCDDERENLPQEPAAPRIGGRGRRNSRRNQSGAVHFRVSRRARRRGAQWDS